MNSAESSAANVGFWSMAGDCSTRHLPVVLCYRFMSRLLVLATSGAILLSPLTGETQWSADGGLSPRIGVFLDFDQEPPLAAIQAMEREVGAAMSRKIVGGRTPRSRR